MNQLIRARAPAFIAGVAIQQLLSILDPLIDRLVNAGGGNKRLVMGLLSLVVGLFFAFSAGLRTLQPFGVASPDWVDAIVTGLFISGGTEGFNSISKFLLYAKQDKKAQAAQRSDLDV